MRDQIQKLLHAVPFQPFSVDGAEDVAYAIPAPERAWIGQKVLVIEDDKGLLDLISFNHIRRVSDQAPVNNQD